MSGRLAVKQGYTRKRCPKCGGNLFVDKDIVGWFEECLQCGHTSDLMRLVQATAKANQSLN